MWNSMISHLFGQNLSWLYMKEIVGYWHDVDLGGAQPGKVEVESDTGILERLFFPFLFADEMKYCQQKANR